MRLQILIFVLAGTILVGGVSYFSNSDKSVYDQKFSLHLEGKEISLIIVNTPESKTRGLGGMDSLQENSAMLFTFDGLDKYGIWMKDMKFPIDIFWLDENRKIIYIEKNVSPETYPKVFFPPEKSLFVLEANAGFAEKNNLTVGKVLDFDEKP